MASNTQRLNLLKKDPVADGADTFNIETMLNENWEKIDKGVVILDDTGKIPEEQLPDSVPKLEEGKLPSEVMPESGVKPTTHASTHKTGGADALTASDIGACMTPKAVSVTLTTSGWSLVSGCYEQTVACSGLLSTDTQATVTVLPNGGSDADARILIDEAYAAVAGPGGKFVCETNGQLKAICPKGGAKPTVALPLIVCIAR